MEKNNQAVIEALIFAASEPVSYKELKAVIPDLAPDDLVDAIKRLNVHYEEHGRAFEIVEIANGWQFVTRLEFAAELKELFQHRVKGRLSKPALETLAIVAYRQPVTKTEIEAIRGVNADAMLKSLLEKGFVKITGRKEEPGRPIIYETTEQFLQYFGIASLKDLPDISEFVSEADIQERLKQGVVENESNGESETVHESVAQGDFTDRSPDIESPQSATGASEADWTN